MSGRIHTFYSYKGGVGRTLCLANVSVLLARWGWNVLCIDMDLEAPGLARYFAPLLGAEKIKGGVVDWLTDIREGGDPDSWRDRIITIQDSSLSGKISMLPAGDPAGDSYLQKVQALDWNALYQNRNMGQLLEDFKTSVRAEYDLILIDSRTGVSDSGGICTIQLPDAITFFFTPNEQSLYGAASTMRHVQAARMKSVTEPGPALMLPVLTRFEQEKEYQKANQWRQRILKEIGDFYLPWIPSPRSSEHPVDKPPETEISPGLQEAISAHLDQATVPQIAFWSFGEPLPVLDETSPRKDMISYAYENIASLIANGFSKADDLLRERSSYLARARMRKQSDHPKVFLSYSKEFSEIAQNFKSALREAGVTFWNDIESIRSGLNTDDAVAIGIRESESLVVIDSGHKSRWVDKEIATYIRTRAEDGNELNIIPIQMDADKSNPLLQGFQSIDGRDAVTDGGMTRLVEQIKELIQPDNTTPQHSDTTTQQYPRTQ